MNTLQEIMQTGINNRRNFLGDKVLDKMQLNMAYYHDNQNYTISDGVSYTDQQIEFLSYMIYEDDKNNAKSIVITLLVDGSDIRMVKIYNPTNITLQDVDMFCENTVQELINSGTLVEENIMYVSVLKILNISVETSIKKDNKCAITISEGDIDGTVIFNKELTERNITYMTIMLEGMVMYLQKNTDYGDSAYSTMKLYGEVSALTRLTDKWLRANSIIFNNNTAVVDEKLIDTVMDLMNYSAIFASWIRDGKPRMDSATEMLENM